MRRLRRYWPRSHREALCRSVSEHWLKAKLQPLIDRDAQLREEIDALVKSAASTLVRF